MRAIAAGESARDRGCYSVEEFRLVTRWKTPRSAPLIRSNSKESIRDATELALRTSDERLRLGVLTSLRDIEVPTASVLLHLAHRDRYPILDYRALWSVGVDPAPSYYSFRLWQEYVAICRRTADDAGVDMRTLDRALWQYSNEHQALADH